jgi:hypothetical protein
MKIKKIISILAIICGVGFHGRFLVGLILDSIEYPSVSWGPILMPAYAFTTSLTFCGVLGFFDLTKTKNGLIFFWAAIIFSTMTLVVGGALIPGIPFYSMAGLIFVGLNFIAIFVFENVGVNRITAAINIFLILITPFTTLR